MGEFNLNDILTEDEVSALFVDEDTDETSQETPPEQKENNQETNDTTEVDVDDIFSNEDDSESPESVGSEENKQEKEDTTSEKNGTSPNNFYSSIAKALKEDGILSDLDDDILDKAETPEDFANLIETQIQARLDEKQKRIDEALGVGVEPTAIQQYERTLDYLDSLTEESITDESDKGETLRKQLIYQDFINRGYSKERANREVQKSFNAGSDIEDAKEALQSNKDFFKKDYDKLIKEAKDAETKRQADQKKEAETLKKSILEDDKVFGELVVDKTQRRKIFENISKPVYKDPETGEYLTAIQKYEQENHTDFMKYVGLIYTLTDGFKNLDGLVKNKVNKEMKKGLKNLENTLNNSTRNHDGTLNFVTSRRSDDDDSYFGKGGWVPDI
jgi:hypothetical protein